MEDDRAHYARRAQTEFGAAASATDAEARRRHFELAEMLRVKSMLNGHRRSASLLK